MKPAVEDRRLAEMLRLGVPEAAARAWLSEQEPEGEGPGPGEMPDCGPFVIWRENAAVWGCWMRLQTQWRTWPGGALQGLRYEALDVVLRRCREGEPDALFDQLIEMEHAALEAQNHG